MNQYKVTYSRSAQRFIDKEAPKPMRERLRCSCEALGREPRPPGCVKMSGVDNQWRIREGVYRIVYAIYDRELLVEVIDVDHRKDVYR